MQNILKYRKQLAILAISLCVMSGCGSGDTESVLKISVHTSEPTDTYNEKEIVISDYRARLELDASLKMEGDSVEIQVVDEETNEVIWSKQYVHDTEFLIGLSNVKANSKYLLVVGTKQTQKVELTLSSDQKLIRDIIKPQ
jgi:hypothetical protein